MKQILLTLLLALAVCLVVCKFAHAVILDTGQYATPTDTSQIQLSNAGSGNGVTWTAVPNCIDSAGQHLNYTAATFTFSCGTTGGGSGSVTGSGTVGTIPLWSVSTTNLSNSLFTQSGAVITLTGDQIISGLTASSVVATDGSKKLISAATTGSGNVVLQTSPTLITPALGTPSSGTLTNATGLPISSGVSGLGTGIATALGVNTGSAGAPVLFNGALGTPSSGTLTSATGLPLTTGVTGVLPVANGGTNLNAAADDNVMVGNDTTWETKAMPNCTDTAGNHLNYTASTNSFSCGTTSGTSSAFFGGSGGAAISTSNTNFMSIYQAVGPTATEANASYYWMSGVNGTFKNLSCFVYTAPGGVTTRDITLRDLTGAADCGFTCHLTGASTTCSDLVTTCAYTANHFIQQKWTVSGGPAGTGGNCYVEFVH